MATKIKLQRLGKVREPHYRIVVADAKTRRSGRAIEVVGEYHPKNDPSVIRVETERVQYWLGVGAQPTESVEAILKVTGDWQQFRGEPAPAPMRTVEPKADKKTVFEEAVRAAGDTNLGEATTPRKRTAKKAEAKAEGEPTKPEATDASAPQEAAASQASSGSQEA